MYETKECPLRYTISQKKGAYIANIITLGIVRHPAQLYESLSMLFVFLFLFYWWQRQKGKIIAGTLFSTFLIFVFGLRFFYEFIKENQVDFEAHTKIKVLMACQSS